MLGLVRFGQGMGKGFRRLRRDEPARSGVTLTLYSLCLVKQYQKSGSLICSSSLSPREAQVSICEFGRILPYLFMKGDSKAQPKVLEIMTGQAFQDWGVPLIKRRGANQYQYHQSVQVENRQVGVFYYEVKLVDGYDGENKKGMVLGKTLVPNTFIWWKSRWYRKT